MNEEMVKKWEALQEPADVVLLSPPFTWPVLASVALSLFQRSLNEAGIRNKVIYPMFLMGSLIGSKECDIIADMARSGLFEEMLFAHMTDIENSHTPKDLLDLFYNSAEPQEYEGYVQLLNKAKEAAEITVEASARRIIGMKAKVLAVSSVFSQLNASLAICKRVKELDPSVRTVMGGYVAGATGLRILKDYPSIDYISFGEGDETMVDICSILLGQKEKPMPYGTIGKADLEGLSEAPYRLTKDLNDAAMPEYGDYFEEIHRVQEGFYGEDIIGHISNTVYLEGSRGCWWGEKHPCSFCGLNGLKNVFRQKDPERIYQELHDTARQYPGNFIQLTDNILSSQFFREVLPKMAEDEETYRVFAEVKSNLKDSELIALSKAGVTELQPGIESLNDHLLTLMGKGNTAINHVYLLKMCEQYGLTSLWNVLYGIPGEEEADYRDMIELMPKLSHLKAPSGTSSIRFQRFSRYTMCPEEYGLVFEPWNGTQMVYGDHKGRCSDMTVNYEEKGPFNELYQSRLPLYAKVIETVNEWRNLNEQEHPPVLQCIYLSEKTLISDSRPITTDSMTMMVLTGLEDTLYRMMEEPVSETALKAKFSNVAEEEINQILDELEHNNLMIRCSGKVMALAVNRTKPEA